VRTIGSPLAMASLLRQEVTRGRREFRVSQVRTQAEIIQAQTVRDRLLAMLALFFTTVALVLAGVGLYGVLEYSVVQLRRDIGIRLALGAGPGHVARRVALRSVSMVAVGAVVGLGLSLALARYIQTLLYGVSAANGGMAAVPLTAVLSITLLAAIGPVMHASRIDPAAALRAD
jgi:ABC-type antimicrobial peptide transport system permease subunit